MHRRWPSEVAILNVCKHPHLLPLLGYCLRKEAPCLVFPLIRGGSLQCRLQPTDESRMHLRRLGLFTADPRPLTWRQRLRAVYIARDSPARESSRALANRRAAAPARRD